MSSMEKKKEREKKIMKKNKKERRRKRKREIEGKVFAKTAKAMMKRESWMKKEGQRKPNSCSSLCPSHFHPFHSFFFTFLFLFLFSLLFFVISLFFDGKTYGEDGVFLLLMMTSLGMNILR